MGSGKRNQPEAIEPLDWHDLVGFVGERQRFRGLLDRDRLPQVMLLTGREAIGKRLLAASLAAMHYCPSACGHCSECQAIAHFQHAEVLWLEGAAIKIDDAARLQEHLTIKASGAFQSGQRPVRLVVVIDADHMTVGAANRLLKILEEPPPDSRVIMTTSEWQRVLPTIRSRSVQWHLAPPPLADSVQWLQRRLAAAQASVSTSGNECELALRQEGLAPGAALAALLAMRERLADDQTLHDLINSYDILQTLAAAETLVKRNGWSAADLVKEVEVHLNKDYRRSVGKRAEPLYLDPMTVQRRRENLRTLRRLALGSKIALSAQLAAESLGLAES